MNKFFTIMIAAVLGLTTAMAFILYLGEAEKNKLLRQENQKSVEEIRSETNKFETTLKEARDANLEQQKKLLSQVNKFSDEREKAVKDLEDLKKKFAREREFSLVANDDMNKLRSDVARMRTEGRDSLLLLEKSFQRKKQAYETKVLSAEAQLEKVRGRLSHESERYHYNLGVIYTQGKDFDSAVSEFKMALGYNPKNAACHYNLGIIFDDYFKDKENARYYYRSFLELAPTSEDAENVKEWLKDIDN